MYCQLKIEEIYILLFVIAFLSNECFPKAPNWYCT